MAGFIFVTSLYIPQADVFFIFAVKSYLQNHYFRVSRAKIIEYEINPASG